MAAKFCGIVAFALLVAALLSAAPARAADVAVVVRPLFSAAEFATAGAVGEFVAGAGPWVSRESALAAVETGKVRNSLLGGKPGGPRLIQVSGKPAEITIYVSLPPPGWHDNDRRYPIAIVGGGYQGILTSPSTRIRGLVSIADIAPTAIALERDRKPTIRAESDSDAPATLTRLERRLTDARDVRWPAALIMIVAVISRGLLAIAKRSQLAGRAALLAPPTALAASLLLSGAGVTRPALVGVLLATAVFPGALALAAVTRRPVALAAALVAVLVLYLIVLAAWPEVNAVSAYGPHADEGGRFYGLPNRVETILLLPALLAVGLLGLATVIPVAALALATVGLSATGADGGGLIVMAAGFLALALRLRGRALQPRTIALGAGAVLALALAIVGIDAALGGSSHVTRAVGGGPTELAGDFARRIELSFERVTSSLQQGLFFLIGLSVLAVPGLARPRSAVRDALLVAIAVSLVVNDAPIDAVGYGAMVTIALWIWERASGPVE